jgi:lysozyme
MTETLLGVDVSHWQGVMDWRKANNAGVKFAFIKATEGLNWYDPQFSANVSGAREYEIPVGIYHYWRGLVAPELQFANIIKSYEAIEIGDTIPIAIDVESHDGPTPTQTRDMLAKFVQLLIDETGKLPTNYTSKERWDRYVAQYDRWEELPLWVANWDTSEPILPRDWSSWYIWQYKKENNGYKYGAEQGKQIDLNYVKPAYLEFYGIGQSQPEPTPIPAPEMPQILNEIIINGVKYTGEMKR